VAAGGERLRNAQRAWIAFRDAKLMEIGAGTSEIRRMLIGRELMAAE
jgi:isovaleryl-CoA dehydrogenase